MVTTATQGSSGLSCHLTLQGHPLVGPQTTGSQNLRVDQGWEATGNPACSGAMSVITNMFQTLRLWHRHCF